MQPAGTRLLAPQGAAFAKIRGVTMCVSCGAPPRSSSGHPTQRHLQTSAASKGLLSAPLTMPGYGCQWNGDWVVNDWQAD